MEFAFSLEMRIITPSGRLKWIQRSSRPNPSPSGGQAIWSGFMLDITDRKRTEGALRVSEERLNFALQNSFIGAWEMDLRDNSTSRTRIHDRIYGYETMLPRWTYEMFLEHILPEDRPEVDRIFHEATAAKANWSYEFRIRRADGEVRWIYAAGGHLRSLEGNFERVSGIVQDITERKRLEEKLQQQATTDELTGLTNRRHFLELAYTEIKRARRLQHPLTIALIDIDHFKRINDSCGHPTGDHALLALTQVCQKNIREIDVFARFGGDEFVLLLPEISSEQACEVMERICVALASQPVDVGGKLLWLTVSSGLSSLAEVDDSLEKLLDRADQALYRAKEAGRNRVMVETCF